MSGTKQDKLKDEGHQTAVQYPQRHAAQHVGEVVDAQIHARVGDGARQEERGDPHPRRTRPEQHREGAEGRRAVTRGKGVILRLIDFHILVRDLCRGTVASDLFLDDDLAEQVVHAQRSGQDDADAKVLGDEQRDDVQHPPDQSRGACVGERHHDLVQHGTVNLRHPLNHARVEFTQFFKHSLLR